MLNMRLRIVAAIGGLLVLLAGADFLVEHHPAFGIDGTPAFAAWYGIVAAAAAIGLAVGWGRLARRAESAAEAEGRDA